MSTSAVDMGTIRAHFMAWVQAIRENPISGIEQHKINVALEGVPEGGTVTEQALRAAGVPERLMPRFTLAAIRQHNSYLGEVLDRDGPEGVFQALGLGAPTQTPLAADSHLDAFFKTFVLGALRHDASGPDPRLDTGHDMFSVEPLTAVKGELDAGGTEAIFHLHTGTRHDELFIGTLGRGVLAESKFGRGPWKFFDNDDRDFQRTTIGRRLHHAHLGRLETWSEASLEMLRDRVQPLTTAVAQPALRNEAELLLSHVDECLVNRRAADKARAKIQTAVVEHLSKFAGKGAVRRVLQEDVNRLARKVRGFTDRLNPFSG